MNRSYLLIAFCFLVQFSNVSNAQTRGMILEPATGSLGKLILDPNQDGLVSQGSGGFISNDQSESEIPFKKMVFPGSEPTKDINNGPDCGFTDFVDSGTEDPAQYYYDVANDALIFRLRMGSIATNAKSYSILIDTDQKFGSSGPNADPNYTSANPGFEIEIVMASKFGVSIYDVDSIPNCTPVVDSTGHNMYQKSIAYSSICTSYNYFLDFYVHFSDLSSHFGINASTPLRMAIVDNMAANKSTLCNPSSASDIGGVDKTCGSLENCFTTIIDNYTPCPVNSVTSCQDRSACPSITGPIVAGVDSVKGTSTEADGTLIKLYKGGAQIGTATVSAGKWKVSGISPVLALNNIITATATASGKSVSIDNCDVETVGLGCTSATTTTSPKAANISTISGNKGIKISNVSNPAGTKIRMYNSDGSSFDVSVLLAGSTNPIITVTGTTVYNFGCQTGQCFPSGVYFISFEEPGKCESALVPYCFNTSSSTAATTLLPASITTSTSSVNGVVGSTDNVAGVTILLYINGSVVKTATTVAGGSWTISPVSFSSCDTVTVRAIASGKCYSASAANVIVSGGVTATPVITGSFCTTSPVTSVSGTSSEASGTVIQLYNGITPVGSTTTVNASGVWTVSGLSVPVGASLTAKATASCKTQSAASAAVSVTGKTTNSATITSSPVYEGATSISGTGTAGDLINLYMDEFQISGISTIVDAMGNWTITIPANRNYEIYTGGVLTATATTTGSCSGSPSNSVTVLCTPLLNRTISPTDTSTCNSSLIAKIKIASSQSNIVYQLYNGITSSGISKLGTGGLITLTSSSISSSTKLNVKAFQLPPGSCEVTMLDSVKVNIFPNPTLSLAVSATSPVCSGAASSVSIQNSQTGFSYQLRDDADNSLIGSPVSGNGGTINLPTGNLSANTTFNILVLGASTSMCDGTLTTKPTVTITTVPAVPSASSNTPVCEGNTINLSTPVVAGATYSWTGPAGFASSAQNPTRSSSTVAMAGTYSVTVSLNGCTSSAGTTDVVIGTALATPSASSNTPVCEGNTINLSTPLVAGATYSWTGPSGFTSSAQNPTRASSTAAMAGTYSVTVSLNGCTSSAGTTDVVIGTGLTASSSNTGPYLEGETIQLNGSGASVYSWTGPNGFTSAQQNPFIINASSLEQGVYSLSASSLGCEGSASTTIVVINLLPLTDPEAYNLAEDGNVSGNVSVNDNFTDGPSQVYSVITNVANGILTINAAGAFTYTPDLDFNGTDSFVYELCDGGTPQGCSQDTVSFYVSPVNDAPVTFNEVSSITTSTVLHNTFANGDNDDADGTAVNFATVPVEGPSHGTITISSNGDFTYSAVVGYTGKDTVIVSVCDAGMPLPSLCVNDTLILTILPDGNLFDPILVNETGLGPEDNSVTGSIIGGDSDPDGTTLVTVTSPVKSPSYGSIIISGNGNYTYTPTADFNGKDTIVVSVCDQGTPARCKNDTLFITITPVNDGPVTFNESYSTTTSAALNNTLANGDHDDADGTTVSFATSPVQDPAHGTITISSNGGFTYNADAGYTGKDTVIVSVCDAGIPLPSICVNDTLIITVVPDVNMFDPALVNETDTGSEDSPVSGNIIGGGDSDPDGTTLVALTSPVKSPSHGSIIIAMGGAYTYTPAADFNGKDTIVVSVCDQGTPARCKNDTLFITITEVNDAPVTFNETFSITSSTVLNNTFANGDNDDADGTAVSFATSPVQGPFHGMITISSNGGFTYNANTGYTGKDTVIVSVCDAGLPLPSICINDTLFLDILPDGNLFDPIVDNDSDTGSEDSSPVSGSIIGGDSDPDGTTLLALTSPVKSPSHGSITITGNGNYTYTPAADFNGEDTIVVSVCDQGTPARCKNDTLLITVTPVNDPPVTFNEAYSTTTSAALNNTFANGDNDGADGTAVNFVTTPVQGPSHGTITISSNGDFIYNADAGYTGKDTVIVSLCDAGTPLPSVCINDTLFLNILPDGAQSDDTTRIGVAKDVIGPDYLTDGSFNITYIIYVKNYANRILQGIQLTDDLDQAFPDATQIKIVTPPSVNGGLSANISFNGRSDKDLIVGASSSMAALESDSLTFTINVKIAAGSYSNIALGSYTENNKIFTDTSTAGKDPDLNNNNSGNDPDENHGTPIIIPVIDLEIPEGFSPNGDGVNDYFVITGLERYPDASIRIFNRWGSIVYDKERYQNNWDGVSVNKLTVGHSPLPAGTYFYLLKLGDKEGTVIKGYIYVNP
jgi:gliding motility-associated-like protein